jgi:hypothetical protein
MPWKIGSFLLQTSSVISCNFLNETSPFYRSARLILNMTLGLRPADAALVL